MHKLWFSTYGKVLFRPVARQRLTLVVELAASPQKPVDDEIEVTRIGDGFVVVADSGAEDPGLVLVVVHPSHHVFDGFLGDALSPIGLLFLLLQNLFAPSERLGGLAHLHIVKRRTGSGFSYYFLVSGGFSCRDSVPLSAYGKPFPATAFSRDWLLGDKVGGWRYEAALLFRSANSLLSLN
jgi:hypothetical protein